MPFVGFQGLPRDIADVFGVAEERKLPIFVPRIVGAVVKDARRFALFTVGRGKTCPSLRASRTD